MREILPGFRDGLEQSGASLRFGLDLTPRCYIAEDAAKSVAGAFCPALRFGIKEFRRWTIKSTT